jgi:hypothetical protein
VELFPDMPSAEWQDTLATVHRQAGARRAGWDIARWACPGGITDSHLARSRP